MLKKILAVAVALSIAAGVLFSAALVSTDTIEHSVTLCDFDYVDGDL